MPIQAYFPKKERSPVFVYVMLENQAKLYDIMRMPDAPILPIPELLSRGWGVCVYRVSDMAEDHENSLNTGIFEALDGLAEREPRSWAAISAWAFGATLCMDYLEQELLADCRHIGVVGHSRGGKTALWAGALDTRFSMVVSNNSGCTGAALSKRKKGETIRLTNEGFPYWFCDRYKDFNDRENLMPFDQDGLLALIAPRLLYVASASEDEWADPAAEREACRRAGVFYELYGERGLVCPEENLGLNHVWHGGSIGYHLREGGHAITRFDWKLFLDFADAHFEKANLAD